MHSFNINRKPAKRTAYFCFASELSYVYHACINYTMANFPIRMVLYPGKQDKVLLIPSPVFIQIRPWAM